MAVQMSGSLPVQYDLSAEYSRLLRLRDIPDDDLPKDPRHWSKEHVLQWVNLMTQLHDLPEVPTSRFSMNGKALCLMSLHMFLARVPLGGKLLYKDFQLRLCTALKLS